MTNGEDKKSETPWFSNTGLKSPSALPQAKTVAALGNPLPPKYALPAAAKTKRGSPLEGRSVR